MKRMTMTLAAIAALSVPATALAADVGASDAKVEAGAKADATAEKPPVAEPKDGKAAVGQVKDAIAAAKGGKWWLFAALAVTVLLWLLKFLGTRIGFWAKLGRWRYVIPPVLSLAAALLATFQGGVSIDAAVGVFTASWATASLQELWEHGILGKSRASAGGGA